MLLLLFLNLLSLPCGPEGTGAMLERSNSPEWLAFLRMSAAVDYVHEEAKALLKGLFSGEAVCIKSTLFPIRSPETSVRHTHTQVEATHEKSREDLLIKGSLVCTREQKVQTHLQVVRGLGVVVLVVT